jgi:ribosome biogenesis GTPase A
LCGVPENFLRSKLLLQKADLKKFLNLLYQIGNEQYGRNSHLKVMFVGDENQGKTSLLNCFRESLIESFLGNFVGPKPTETIATNGIDIQRIEVTSLEASELRSFHLIIILLLYFIIYIYYYYLFFF